MTQKHIKGWKVGHKTEMGFPVEEAHSLPMKAKSLAGSVMANFCGSNYALHMSLVEVFCQRLIFDRSFSVLKSVRLARMSHHSHQMLRKMWAAVTGPRVDDL